MVVTCSKATAGLSRACRRGNNLALVALGSAMAAPAIGAHVESAAVRLYPVKAIRIIVASPPGGTADALTRVIGPKLAQAWSQPVVIDNRPGANGIIGAEMTARAAPDGYTVVMAAAGLAANPSLYTRVPYDPVRDFAPVTQAVSVPNVLVVHPSFAAVNVAELVAAGRAGAVTFGSAGKGTSGHLALELFQMASGVHFAHAPYRGGGAALTDLIGAQVQALFSIAVLAMPHVRAGRLRGLAVTGAARSRSAPELPTVAESGYPGFEVTGWFGVLAPAKTPDGIIAKLNTEIVRALRTPEVASRLAAQAADPVGSSPSEFGAHIAAEARKWARVIKQTGIKPD